MGLFDMFDKLDDIIFEPVRAICDWTREPLKKWEHKREMETQSMNQAHQKEMHSREIQARERAEAAARAHEQEMLRTSAQHEEAMARQNAENERELAEQAARLEAERRIREQQLTEQERASLTADYEARERINADVRRWNAEIDRMIMEQEDARRDRLVESIKRYQIDLATASQEIVENIGIMSLELRERANAMVLEKTQSYYALQEKAKDDAMARLREINELFANDERIRIRMQDSVVNNMDAIIIQAGRFITELADDIKKLNSNTDELMRLGMANVDKFIQPMGNLLGAPSGNPYLTQAGNPYLTGGQQQSNPYLTDGGNPYGESGALKK